MVIAIQDSEENLFRKYIFYIIMADILLCTSSNKQFLRIIKFFNSLC